MRTSCASTRVGFCRARTDPGIDGSGGSTKPAPSSQLVRPLRWLPVLALAGCAFGHVREASMGPLGSYRAVHAVRVDVVGRGSSQLGAELAVAASREIASNTELSVEADGSGSFRLQLDILEAASAPAIDGTLDTILSDTRSFLGATTSSHGKLVVQARLFPPGAAGAVGAIRWASEGDATTLVPAAATDIAQTLRQLMKRRRDDFVLRRAADERLLLTPSPLTMQPGEVAITDDELLLFRFAVGLSRRLQLDMFVGGLPIAGGGGTVLAERAVVAVGGGGVAVIGFFDLGLKASILHETEVQPGLSLSYDMLDLFGLAVGGAGVALLADGAGGAGYGVVGGTNLQFNILALTLGKHFGSSQVTAGMWVIDNHHFLPQSAGFQTVAVGGAGNADGGGATVESGPGKSVTIPRLPTQYRPYLGFEYVFGPHVSLMTEALPGRHLATSYLTTGVRFLLGANHPVGFLALDRIRFRLDLATIWSYIPGEARSTSTERQSGSTVVLPWLGMGFYFM